MIEQLTTMPAGVIGFEAVGEVVAADYHDTLVPAIEAAVEEHGKVRLVYVIGDRFDGYSASAALEDVKLGVRDFRVFERCAVVSDNEWIRRALAGFGWMIPGDFKAFGLGELERATAWAAATD